MPTEAEQIQFTLFTNAVTAHTVTLYRNIEAGEARVKFKDHFAPQNLKQETLIFIDSR